MSKGSIVKSYDLSISIPKGDFQSMLAIQTMPTGKSLLPLDSIIDKYLGLNMVNKDENSLIANHQLKKRGLDIEKSKSSVIFSKDSIPGENFKIKSIYKIIK